MELKPVNKINSDANTIRVSDGNSPIRLIFKDAKGEVINLYDKIDYFYLTKDDETFFSVTDISYEGDEVIFRLPKLRKGQYKAEIRDKDGSIYPANEDLYILLRRSFEDDKDIYYFGHREDILNSVEPMVIQHIEKNPDKFRGERGQQGFPGRDGLPGIDGKDGKDGIDGEKGDPGRDGSMSFVDLTPEEKEELRGERGRPGLDGKDGIDGKDGLPGRDGIDGIDGKDGKDGIIENINPNLIPMSAEYWVNNSSYSDKNGTVFSSTGRARLKIKIPVIKGDVYSISDSTLPSNGFGGLRWYIYDDGVFIESSAIIRGQKTQITMTGNEITFTLYPQTGFDTPYEMLLSDEFKQLVKFEKGDIYTPVINAIYNLEREKYDKKTSSIINYSHLVTDGNWTTALQTALNENDSVYVPPGEYNIGQVTLKDNNEVIGSGNGTVLNGTESEMFLAEGIKEETRNVIKDTTEFGDVFDISTASGLNRFDYVLLQSQRDSISRIDSGEDWTLGGGTNDTHKLPFGEFKSIKSVGSNQITLSSQPIFPSYLSHSGNETNPAQSTSTVSKVNFVKNVKLRDFKVTRSNSGTVIRSRWAKDMTVENVYFDDNNFGGYATTFIAFVYSLDCEAINCRYESNVDSPASTYYHKNVFKATSSMYCGFTNCKAKGAGQTSDFSYISGMLPCTGCYIDGCKFEDATSTGLTAHGGTYMTRFTNNIVTNTFQGIGCRSRRAIITNNIVIGNRESTAILQYGIGLYEGLAVDCIIKGNTVTNFRYGIGIFDAVNEDRWFRYSGTVIDSNTISECYRHIFIHRHPSRPDTDFMNVRISNNTFRQTGISANTTRYMIELPEGVNGVTIDGNIFGGTTERISNLMGIYANPDCNNIRVINNQFYKLSTAFIFRGNLSTGSKLTEKGGYQIFGNAYEEVENKHSIQTGRSQVIPTDDVIHAVSPDGRGWNITVDNNGNIITEKYLN